MRTYIPNNINFRIVSSNSIAKFKQDQAFDFYEIVKMGDKISDPAKEVILLEYDHWFKWIILLERSFLLLTEHDNDDKVFDQVDLMLKTEMSDIIDIMSIHTEFFDPELTKFVRFIHKYSTDALSVTIKNAIKLNDLGVAFSKIVFFISIYLQQVLFAMQEIESIDENKISELFYSGWCKEVCEVEDGICKGICPITERAKYYSELKKCNKFIIKNITKNDLSDECVRKMEKHNIIITEIKRVQQDQLV